MTSFDYWYVGFIISTTMLFSIIFIVLHTHVWVRNGYAGKNKILEPHEVDKLVAHIIAEACLVMLWLVVVIEPLVYLHYRWTFSWDSKALIAGGFLGSGIYIAFKGKIHKVLNLDESTKSNK